MKFGGKGSDSKSKNSNSNSNSSSSNNCLDKQQPPSNHHHHQPPAITVTSLLTSCSSSNRNSSRSKSSHRNSDSNKKDNSSNNNNQKSSLSSSSSSSMSKPRSAQSLFSSISIGGSGHASRSSSARASRTGSSDADSTTSGTGTGGDSDASRRNSAQQVPPRRHALIPVLDFGGEFEHSPSSATIGAHELNDLEAQFNEAAASRQMSSSNKIKSIAQDMKTIFVGKGNSSKSSSSSLNAQQQASSPMSGSESAGAQMFSGGAGAASSSSSSSQPANARLVGAPVTPADIAAVTQAVVDSWMQTFDAVLSHKVGLDLFRQFLRSEFSEENIEFWIACENYRALPESQVEDTAREIFENFVTELAPKEINLDAGTRIQCAQLMSAPNRDTFAQAQRRIRALMERDSYQRFLQSSVFQNFVKQNSKSIQR